MIYLVLAAQFESFVHPLTILIAVALSFTGALATLWLTGTTLNLFSQIGMVMLVGLVAKNSILIVEFANQLRERGLGIAEAAFEAGRTRFRPILMTALSTIVGMLPIALGGNREARRVARRRCGWRVARAARNRSRRRDGLLDRAHGVRGARGVRVGGDAARPLRGRAGAPVVHRHRAEALRCDQSTR